MSNQSAPEKSGKIYDDHSHFNFTYGETRYKVWKNSVLGVARSIYVADRNVILHKPDHTADFFQLVCANVIQAMRLKDYVALNYVMDDCILFKFGNDLYTVPYKAKEHDMWVVLPDGRVLEPQWQSESLPSFWKQIEYAKFIQHVGEQTLAERINR
jgi:hypothetical protein